MNKYVAAVIKDLKTRYPWETEFLQAAEEILESLGPVMDKEPKYQANKILERLVEPERVICFRVPWVDDKGEYHVNRGYRIQFNSAIGPYKGGIRFHPKVTLSTLKFLGFEQIFKNSLTSLPMGGGKGGADFDPNGRSDNEIMRFCQSFMAELFRHVGPDTDVPAGDIGVGAREVGYMFGMYKKLANEFTGVFTGKGLSFGGSLIRPQATGFGVVYFAEEMLKTKKDSMKGKTVAISGFGNVSWGAVQKCNHLGAKVVTISGPDGYIYDEKGISGDKIDYMTEMLKKDRMSVAPFAKKYKSAKFFPGKRPWEVKVDVALPCAIQNELDLNDAKMLIKNGCKQVVEGSNMGCTPEAINLFIQKKIAFAPGKASNAGGVATSGLEMSQNSMRYSWTSEEVDAKLHMIMKNIHKACVEAAKEYGFEGNYVIGANIAGFKKVADAMIAQGLV
ncbi:MAG TPA: NADP-specific glutamate dehydrogenase [bacterium]|nr:NADP-specific glutamate dehydrogenase [bacterium]